MTMIDPTTGRRPLEGVAYDTSYLGNDEQLARQIIEALFRLPTDVQDFALERCSFVSVGRTCHAVTYPGSTGVHPFDKRSRNVWFIVIDEDLPAEHAEGIVAHEVAHAWLGHNRMGMSPLDCETQAAELTGQWGFTGLGADPEHCNAPFIGTT